MASDELNPTLRFLSDAGHLLAEVSPETSAYLMSKRGALLFEHELSPSDAQGEHVCGCCGHIMVPGRGSHLEIRNERKKAGRHSGSGNRRTDRHKGAEHQAGITKVITCGHCSRLTEVKLPAPTPISRRRTKPSRTSGPAPSSAATSRVPQEDPAQKGNTANASSKKRAKSRKAGLQALLDQSNATKSRTGGLGLSLADFMQK